MNIVRCPALSRLLPLVMSAFLLGLIGLGTPAFALTPPQVDEDLQQRIEHYLSAKKATVGVAAISLDDTRICLVNGDKRFPMQSVFKFHIALAVLAEVEKGRWPLEQKFRMTKDDMYPGTWSPLRDKYPGGGELSLAEILTATVALSDNCGCDFLLRLVGGPKVVENFVRSAGVTDIAIELNEQTMQKTWDGQFRNWSTPAAAAGLLTLFHRGAVLKLSPSAEKMPERAAGDFLMTTMLETATGAKRLKGKLPPGTPVAHKTGTSGKNAQGVYGAVNDIGIVTVPGGQKFAIAVFVSMSSEGEAGSEAIIADIARMVWDRWNPEPTP